MSAIAAILRFNGEPVHDGEIERLTEAMKARSPDGQRVWREGSIALGHGMLHGTPESLNETQPLSVADGRWRMIWDGRLDNRDELRHELALHHVEPRDNTDPELVLQTYLIHRDRTPERLLGDFAFAIWDSHERRLFCARDHMGARPVYYIFNEYVFAIASEDEALLTVDGTSREPCDERIASYLFPEFDGIDWQHSWLKAVRILMPGTAMSVNVVRRFSRHRYWTPSLKASGVMKSDADYRDVFQEIFNDAVKSRLRVATRAGIMLSGGLDSASIVTSARELASLRSMPAVTTYSALAEDKYSQTEIDSIAQLSAWSGFASEFVNLPVHDDVEGNENFRRLAWSKSHPIDNSLTMQLALCTRAANCGERVMLHGVSGDIVTQSPTDYLRTRVWKDSPSQLMTECRAAFANHTYLQGVQPTRLLAQNYGSVVVPDVVRWLHRKTDTFSRFANELHASITPQFAAEIDIVSRVWAVRRRHLTERRKPFDQLHLRSLFPVGIVRGLEGYERIAGRCGIEFRDPWADRRVVEFFLRMPVDQLVRQGWTKYLVRSTISRECPHSVVWRSDKQNVGWQFTHRADLLFPLSAEKVETLLSRYLRPQLGQATADVNPEHWTRRVLADWLNRLGSGR